jgi:hypothetical protein
MNFRWDIDIYFYYIDQQNDSGMKFLWLSLFLLLNYGVSAQERLAKVHPTSSIYLNSVEFNNDVLPDKKFINIQQDLKLLAVNNPDGAFQRTYMVDGEGETFSAGFMPAAYFMPNNNLIVVSGKRYLKKDSFNPYGASDMTSMLVLTTINSFITKLKIKGR